MSEILLEKLDRLRKNGELNAKDARREENLHRIFMYPGMMVPKAQTLIVDAITQNLPPDSWVIDPFMGAGTSLLSCMEFGYNVFGQDINPFAVILTKAKTGTYDIEALNSSFSQIKNSISIDKRQTVDVNFKGINKWFKKGIQKDLSKIRRAIQQIDNKELRYFFWIVLSEVIRTGSNDRTSTYKLHQRTTEEIEERKIDVISNFYELCERGIKDFEGFKMKLMSKGLINEEHYVKNISIIWGNSMKMIDFEHKFDILVSSPPYGDNRTTVTYGQHSYLELQWIDQNDLPAEVDFDFLKTTQEIDSQSLGGKLNTKYIKEIFDEMLGRIPSLKSFFSKIPNTEYYKYYKTIAFINDFEKSLDNIILSMSKNAYYVWTIGNRRVAKREIPNDLILIDLMENRNIKLFYTAERRIINKKQPNKNNFSKTMDKEHILIFGSTRICVGKA